MSRMWVGFRALTVKCAIGTNLEQAQIDVAGSFAVLVVMLLAVCLGHVRVIELVRIDAKSLP